MSRVALVTGGTRGIGAAISIALKNAGYRVAAYTVNDIMGARWLHDDMPIPPAMPQIRQQHKDDIYEVSGAGDALRAVRRRPMV